MPQYELIATTTFGLEAVVKRELQQLNFEVLRSENGKITFLSDEAGIARANLWLRTADRVLLKVGEFKAVTFDQLFDQTVALPWANYISADAAFPVNGKSVKSTLFSISDSQAIVKKAIVESLKKSYAHTWFPESGAPVTILVSLLNDIATLTIDTSGVALHKRGYRQTAITAPLKETLASAMIQLSYWNKDRVLFDVFCGSGTIPIEAAMIARNIAPGLNRDFAFKHWAWLDDAIWKEENRKAYLAIDHDVILDIRASDFDPIAIEAAKSNAEEAGVDDCITFTCADFRSVRYDVNHGVLITNPPYGERLMDDAGIQLLYKQIAQTFGPLQTWSLYIITSFPGFGPLDKRTPDRVRKLYNGNIETLYYQFQGPKPPLK
jgi:putative N6-adenine-specific DNA methylase